MSYSLMQTGAEISVSGGTSGNITLNGVGAGHLLTAQVVNDSDGTHTFSASDNNGNTWHTAVHKESGSGVAPNGGAAIFYAGGVNSGNTKVTITASGAIVFHAFVQEWSSTLGSTWSVAASDSNLQSTSVTSQQASVAGINPGAPCIAMVTGVEATSGSTQGAGSGYTALSTSSGFDLFEYQIFSSTPTNEHGAWTTSVLEKSVSVIAAFTASGGGAAVAGAFIGGGMGSFIG